MWANGQRLSAGYEWERETNPLVDAYELDNNAFFVQQQSTIAARWFVTAGVCELTTVRATTPSSVPKLSAGGFILPPRRGAVSSVKVFGNIGKGIKSPSFAERFGDAIRRGVAGTESRAGAHRGHRREATFAHQRIRAGVTYFNNDYRDQVAFQFFPVGDGSRNTSTSTGRRRDGWEVEGGAAARVPRGEGLRELRAGRHRGRDDPQHEPAVSAGTAAAAPAEALDDDSRLVSFWRAVVNGDIRFIGDRHDSSFLFLETVPNAAMPTPIFTDITVNPGYTVADSASTCASTERSPSSFASTTSPTRPTTRSSAIRGCRER